MEVVGAEDGDSFRLKSGYREHCFSVCVGKRWKCCNGID